MHSAWSPAGRVQVDRYTASSSLLSYPTRPFAGSEPPLGHPDPATPGASSKRKTLYFKRDTRSPTGMPLWHRKPRPRASAQKNGQASSARHAAHAGSTNSTLSDRSDRHDPARHDTNGENPPFASQSRIWSSLLLDIGTNGQLDKVLLICRAVCQVGRVDRVRWAGGLGWSGGRDAGLGVGVASLMMRGLGTPGPGFVLPACAV